MNIIFGFGKTEEDFEQQEFNFVENFLIEKAKAYVGSSYDFSYTDELVKELKDELDKRSKEYKKLYDKYEEAKEYPNRYSYYWFNIVHDLHDLCVIFNFHHINRRHPFSADGWGFMAVKKTYYADIWDFRDNYIKSVAHTDTPKGEEKK